MAGTITVDVGLYGSLARHGGGKHYATLKVELPDGARMKDLLAHLGVADDEKGITFINAILCDMPGLQADREDELHDGDHVGIFSTTHMWPYQYRDGIRMTPNLQRIVNQRGTLHHAYSDDE